MTPVLKQRIRGNSRKEGTMLRKIRLAGDPGVSGGELGPDNGPVSLCHLQFGGEALRPDDLLGVVLLSLILLSEELADVLHSAFGGTGEGTFRVGRVRRRGGVVNVQRLEITTKLEYGDWG